MIDRSEVLSIGQLAKIECFTVRMSAVIYPSADIFADTSLCFADILRTPVGGAAKKNGRYQSGSALNKYNLRFLLAILISFVFPALLLLLYLPLTLFGFKQNVVRVFKLPFSCPA